MAAARITGARIAGMAACVPNKAIDYTDGASLVGEQEALRISDSIGVKQRRVAEHGTTSGDLCLSAARRLIDALGWPGETIGAVIFVSQTPDYIVPATACCIQSRLGLTKSCAAFDINLGCSGYVYGLWIAEALISTGGVNRLLLLAGDTSSSYVSPADRSVAMLFGDAGTATAITLDPTAPPTAFELGTDGSGYEHLIIPAGGCRLRRNGQTGIPRERENGNVRSDEQLFMNGSEIFGFSLREVPRMLRTVLATQQWSSETPDAYVLHQANRFMLQHLAKKTGIPATKLPLSLQQYGNTSSASIPITICECLSEPLNERSLNLVLAGFGVGLSWAAAAVTCGPALILKPEVHTTASESDLVTRNAQSS